MAEITVEQSVLDSVKRKVVVLAGGYPRDHLKLSNIGPPNLSLSLQAALKESAQKQ